MIDFLRGEQGSAPFGVPFFEELFVVSCHAFGLCLREVCVCRLGLQAKNLVPDSGGKASKIGEKVLEIQRRLPQARVVYCSATGELPK